jgi:thiol-disulfide isomerase/thioredoxin
MRLLCAAAVSLTLGLFVAFADDATPAQKLKELQKKFDTEIEELRTRFNNAKTPAEEAGIRSEVKELAIITSQKAIKLAEDNAKDAVGFDAAVFVIEKTARYGAGKELETALTIISEHHLNNPKVKTMLPMLAGAGRIGQKFLQTAAEKATDKEVTALALYFLGTGFADQIEDEEDDKKVDELIAKATDCFDKAGKLAPDAKVGESTIAKEVAAQLETFKAIQSLAVGKAVPDIEGTDLDGKKVKLSSYKGKVVLVDIWATWCGPCVRMIPHEREMVKKLKDKPFTLLSVSCDRTQEVLTKFFEKEAMPWDHWYDGPAGKVAKAFRVRAFPTLYLIDHTGTIRHKWVGSPETDKLDKAVEDLVQVAIKAKG